jgi:serine/threonine protein kinase
VADRSQTALPRQIGRYRIVGRIGRGAMGVVFEAFDEQMNRPVALKVLMGDFEADPETRARFYREARAAARLVHPNIISVYDAGEDQGRSFIAMQLLHGAPLPTYLVQPEAAALERKLDLMMQVCKGLAAAHAEGIVHRDLKPSNLFVQSDGVLKILDFGVARVTDSSMTALGTMLGTPDYMSPEQARGEAVDARSDIFSAGSVFYFMLTGRKPFPGPDLHAVLRQLQFEEPGPLAGVPTELATLIAQAMAKSQDHRPGGVDELLSDLGRFRRQYRGDALRLAISLRTQFEEQEALAASLCDTCVALGIDDARPDRLADLRSQYPFLVVRATSVESIPFDRNVLGRVAQALQTSRDQLGSLLQTRYRSLRQIEAGEQAAADGDVSAAMAMFESALSDCPDSVRARQRLEEARALAREQQGRRERVLQLLAVAQDGLATGDLGVAQARCNEALRLEPHNEPAAALSMEVQQAVLREQRRVAESIQRLLERFEAALGRHAFDEASVTLDEADTIQRELPAVADARHRLAEARAADAAAELLRTSAEDEFRLSRAAFRRGRYDEAVQRLERFHEAEPSAPGVSKELEHLRALRADITQRTAAAGGRAREQLSRAAAARDRGAMEDACAALREALAWDPTNGAASEMLDDLLLQRLETRLALERTRAHDERLTASAPILAAARIALDSGYIAVALSALSAAQRVSPDLEGLSALVEDVRRQLSGEDRDTFDLKPLPSLAPSHREGEQQASPAAGVLERAVEWARSTLGKR